MKQSALRDALSLVLAKKPGSTARYLADVIGVSKSSVNAVLYKYPQKFVATAAATPRWSLLPGDAAPSGDAPPRR